MYTYYKYTFFHTNTIQIINNTITDMNKIVM
jgi:hypothetical protein